MVQLGEHFSKDETSRHSEWLRQQRWFIRAREDKERKQEAADKFDENFAALASEVVAATTREIHEFQTRLDSYDEATVIALMENQERLDAVRAEINDLLSRAYVMEDGRRVFKTEDGTQVFDEFGQEVDQDELDFELIGAERPSWEEMSANLEIENQLVTEREQLIEFQGKVDDARIAADAEDFSKDELDNLDAELLELMPDSVRTHVPGLEPTAISPDLKAEFLPSARPIKLENHQAKTFDTNVPG